MWLFPWVCIMYDVELKYCVSSSEKIWCQVLNNFEIFC